MLPNNHPLPQVTAAVEQASRHGLYSYEAVKTFLEEEPIQKLCAVSLVWSNRVDHFDPLVSR
jgi:hypothetical protein